MKPLLVALLLFTLKPQAQAPAQIRPYTQLFVFGDSYSDTGAGDGGVTNGPTAVAYLAQHLNIPFTYFGDPAVGTKGLNFAVSGAPTGLALGAPDPNATRGRGMRRQVEAFAALVQSGAVTFDPAQTMFFLAGGLNDRKLPAGSTRTNLEADIEVLYAAGARGFLVALLPTRIPDFATAGTLFNPEIARIPADERALHPDIRIANSDWGPFFDEVITHPAPYGLTDTTTPCTVRTAKEESPNPCASPQTHFYYHTGHPSTAADKAVGEMLYQEALKQPNQISAIVPPSSPPPLPESPALELRVR